ncbi:hypothetical protein [Luteibaculum oceani]|uniref:Cytochrome C Planctomycete-type domain-containing protein n=1 Tax=Luteibaculum oceani TaxID=1294296 RepID=A0A5C6VAS4_9FLAO|nr:hypothetical protein [Luteibaculum oceani]TXC81661.1 hypothetical protein FRX97_03860 [Luteibaculum oceani]
MYKYVGVVILVGISFFACKKEKTNADPINTSAISCADVDSTFASGVRPIIAKSCAIAGCHKSPGRGGVILESYEQISTESQKSRFLIAIKRSGENGVSPMPPSNPLTAEEVKSISCWIDAGSLDN